MSTIGFSFQTQKSIKTTLPQKTNQKMLNLETVGLNYQKNSTVKHIHQS